MWNEEDGSFYDVLHLPNGERTPMKVRSMVGLNSAVCGSDPGARTSGAAPQFQTQARVFCRNRRDLTSNIACMRTPGNHERRLLSIVDADKNCAMHSLHAG